mgnify:FL=1
MVRKVLFKLLLLLAWIAHWVSELDGYLFSKLHGKR